MELRQLKYFLKISETLNFNEAAKQLYISQSTLSQQIMALEGELQCKLFLRNKRSVTLTEEGEYFLTEARETLMHARQSIEKINDVKKLRTGTLNIGSSYSFSTVMIPTILEFTKAHPDIKINLYINSINVLLNMLNKQELDIIASFRHNEVYENIESHPLFDSCLCAIVSKDNPLANNTSITLAQLQKAKLALPVKGMQSRNIFENLCTGTHLKFDIRMEIDSTYMLLDIVSKSDYVSILAKEVYSLRDNIVAVPIQAAENNILASFSLLKNKYVKNSLKEFIQILIKKNTTNLVTKKWFGDSF